MAVVPTPPTSVTPSPPRRWRRVLRSIPTTAVGMERAIALVIAGIRIGTLVQMAPSLAPGMEMSALPGLYVASWVVAAAMSVAVSAVVLARDEPVGGRLFVVDVVIAVGLLVVGDLCVPDDQRIGTWVGFQPGYALAVALSGASVRGTGLWAAGLLLIVAADVWFRWPATTQENVSTVIGNALTYLVLVSVGRTASGYMRRVAADGDAARARAAELGRREEEQRAQLAIHNGASVMRLLADPTLPDAVRAVLQREADLEARRMRSYLQGVRFDRADGDDERRGLADQVAATATRFGDLPLTTALDLAEGVLLPASLADALDHALAALLHNVRDHAGASAVVVHADVEPGSDGEPGRWVVTLHDDGRGFDVDPAGFGVGLREVVHGQLARHDVDVELTSRPGQGSAAVLSGPIEATAVTP